MLRLPKFRYLAPKTLSEAVKILADHGPEAMLVAGGTDVYPKMKRRQFRPKVLVSLRGLKELVGIRGDHREGLVIGAGTTLTRVAAHPEIRRYYPGLAEAAGAVSTPILRNMGTIGGNLCLDTRCNYYDQTHHWREALGWCKKAPGPGPRPGPQGAHGRTPLQEGEDEDEVPCRVAPGSPRCWAVSSADCAPMMVALGAEVTLVGPQGERTLPVGALYQDDGIRYLTKRPDEVLTEIRLPPADGLKTAYRKLRRRGAFDFPALGAAVALQLEGGGGGEGARIAMARIVLGGIASCPVEMEAAEEALLGEPLTEEALARAAQATFEPVRPMDNTDFHLYYRKKMTPVYVKRALRQAAGLG